ncbi:MAG: hypothetical protein ACLR1V_01825 [Coprococcus sp.]
MGIERYGIPTQILPSEIVAKYLDKDAPLGVDKELKARFCCR